MKKHLSILNQITTKMLKATEDIVPNWFISSPDPNVSIGKRCKPFKIEMVIRGYLSGHAARVYKNGLRSLCGNKLNDGMKENQKFKTPIITPTTKSEKGHDKDISSEAIISEGIVNVDDFNILEEYTKKLFRRGTEIAKKQGLILVDAKYEFGKTKNGEIILIDEIHTPDSSRYFHEDTYIELHNNGIKPRHLSKEFVREWLLSIGFKGLKGQEIPKLSEAMVKSISERYIELFEKLTGEKFKRTSLKNISNRIQLNLDNYFK